MGVKNGKTLMELHNATVSLADDLLFTNVCVCNGKFVEIVTPQHVIYDPEKSVNSASPSGPCVCLCVCVHVCVCGRRRRKA